MRGVPRWFAVLAVVAPVIVLGAFRARRALAPAAFIVDWFPTQLPADGFTTIRLKLRSSTGRELGALQVNVENPHRAAVESVVVRGDGGTVSLRIGVMPGDTTVRIAAPNIEPFLTKLQLQPSVSDSVGDGTPDFLRLHDEADREVFRRWFTLLAESQFIQKQIPKEINDCASLLRYAYREALREHDSAWVNSLVLPHVPALGSIRQYQYPFTPLGASLFRVREGSFAGGDLNNGTFAQFADAKTLWRYNSHFVGRDISRARRGDLLFFRQDGQDLPFHAMIFIGSSQIQSGRESLLIYNTGPEGKWKGEIRRPTLAELMNFPDPRWRPVPSNPSFLGIYRWNILQGTD
jgi:uncharacterized protein